MPYEDNDFTGHATTAEEILQRSFAELGRRWVPPTAAQRAAGYKAFEASQSGAPQRQWSLGDVNEGLAQATAEIMGVRVARTHPLANYVRSFAENPELLDVVQCLADLTGASASFNPRSPNAPAIWAVSAPHFPALLAETGQIVSQLYESGARAKINTLARQIEIPDFKPASVATASLKVPTPTGHGDQPFVELQARASAALVQLLSLDVRLAVSVQQIVNNDQAVVRAAFESFTGKAYLNELSLVATALNDNPDLDDGDPIFSAGAGNLLTGSAAPSATSYAGAVAALRAQTDESGDQLDLDPSIILTGSDTETAALTLADQLKSGGNPIRVVSTGLLDTGAWYLCASPEQAPWLVKATMTGANGQSVAWSGAAPVKDSPATRIEGSHRVGLAVGGRRGVIKVTF